MKREELDRNKKYIKLQSFIFNAIFRFEIYKLIYIYLKKKMLKPKK